MDKLQQMFTISLHCLILLLFVLLVILMVFNPPNPQFVIIEKSEFIKISNSFPVAQRHGTIVWLKEGDSCKTEKDGILTLIGSSGGKALFFYTAPKAQIGDFCPSGVRLVSSSG